MVRTSSRRNDRVRKNCHDGDHPGALGAVQALSKTGLSADKLGGFLELFKNFALPKLGPDLLKRLLGKVPGLGDLLG